MGGMMIMSWLQREHMEKQKRREAARIETDALDRELCPELYELREIPAVWNHSDLETIDRARES